MLPPISKEESGNKAWKTNVFKTGRSIDSPQRKHILMNLKSYRNISNLNSDQSSSISSKVSIDGEKVPAATCRRTCSKTCRQNVRLEPLEKKDDILKRIGKESKSCSSSSDVGSGRWGVAVPTVTSRSSKGRGVVVQDRSLMALDDDRWQQHRRRRPTTTTTRTGDDGSSTNIVTASNNRAIVQGEFTHCPALITRLPRQSWREELPSPSFHYQQTRLYQDLTLHPQVRNLALTWSNTMQNKPEVGQSTTTNAFHRDHEEGVEELVKNGNGRGVACRPLADAEGNITDSEHAHTTNRNTLSTDRMAADPSYQQVSKHGKSRKKSLLVHQISIMLDTVDSDAEQDEPGTHKSMPNDNLDSVLHDASVLTLMKHADRRRSELQQLLEEHAAICYKILQAEAKS